MQQGREETHLVQATGLGVAIPAGLVQDRKHDQGEQNRAKWQE
jgi:hypothetical protein